MKSRTLFASLLLSLIVAALGWCQEKDKSQAKRKEVVLKSKTIVFLGDSVTYSGQYVAHFESWLLTQTKRPPTIINVGLPSETVSGLSEKGHAGGRFPRPDLAERLERVLKTTKPDLIIACYGINCGIYQPFESKRFQKYQAGIKSLQKAAAEHGAKLILVTPPTFDDSRSRKDFSYNEVMTKYAQWITELRKSEQMVIDLHSAMNAELKNKNLGTPGLLFNPMPFIPMKQDTGLSPAN